MENTTTQMEEFVIATVKQGLMDRKVGVFITKEATTKFLLQKLSGYTGMPITNNPR